MTPPIVVIIAQLEQTGAIRTRLGTQSGAAVFAEAESLQAVEAILKHPPKILALDPIFVATARGATLVARLKSESRLKGVDLRVLLEDEAKVPLILSDQADSPEAALLQTSRPLDRAGTRRADRFPMNRRPITVNGEPSHLVDLSVTGAQVLVPIRLRPTQPVRLTLADPSIETRCQGTVTWSVALPSGSALQYRAGVEFVNPDTARLAAICAQSGIAPDRTFGAS